MKLVQTRMSQASGQRVGQTKKFPNQCTHLTQSSNKTLGEHRFETKQKRSSGLICRQMLDRLGNHLGHKLMCPSSFIELSDRASPEHCSEKHQKNSCVQFITCIWIVARCRSATPQVTHTASKIWLFRLKDHHEIVFVLPMTIKAILKSVKVGAVHRQSLQDSKRNLEKEFSIQNASHMLGCQDVEEIRLADDALCKHHHQTLRGPVHRIDCLVGSLSPGLWMQHRNPLMLHCYCEHL